MTTNLLRAAVLLCMTSALSTSTRAQILSNDFQDCVAKPTQSLQRSCLDDLANRMNNAPTPSGSAALSSAWRLLRSADAGSGAVHIAIMRTVDSARSDAELAGLMLRCAPQGIDPVLVVTQAFARSARPSVTLNAGADSKRLEATVQQAGDILLLPREGFELIRQSRPRAELTVEIGAVPGGRPLRGIVPLAGFPEAFIALQAACGQAPKM